MKSIKIYAQTEHSVVVNITNNNAYPGRPYITVQNPVDGSLATFYSKEDFEAHQQYLRDSQK